MITEITKRYIGRRVMATLIDYTLVFAFQIFYVIEFGDRLGNGSYQMSGWPMIVPILFWFVYIVITEQYIGGTMGHLLLKLKVHSLTNQKMTLWRTFKRRISDCLEISCCFGFVAFLIATNSQNNQRLGDLLARSCVIGKDDLPGEVEFDFEKAEG